MLQNLNGLYKYKDLLEQLVIRDLKIKYRRSFLGYLWGILNPLMLMVIMTIVFSHMFRRGIENFPVYLLSGQIMFNFMNISTNNAMRSIIGCAALLKKVYVPKYIFTVSKVTSSLIDFVLSMGALVMVMLFTGVRFTWYILLVPVVLLLLYVFCVGIGLFLAQITVFFRDVQYIYSVVTTGWMYLTPIFYPAELLPPWLLSLVEMFNPMYCYITIFRELILYGTMPALSLWAYGTGAAVLGLALGGISFRRSQDKFILYI